MVALALAASLLLAAEPAAATAADPLEKLLGGWKVTGTLRGKPLKQDLFVRRALGNTFYELRFAGTEAPAPGMPPYEAIVYIGWDGKAGRYVAHWMDVFGAAGAGVVGTGKRTADGLVLEFPYPSGTFRDTFSYDPKKGSWRLLIEAKGKDGKYTVFADETFESEDVLR